MFVIIQLLSEILLVALPVLSLPIALIVDYYLALRMSFIFALFFALSALLKKVAFKDAVRGD